ncbi:MAG: CpsD/CapB family tyrosine-protein kinase [Herpetosiphon sp.]|nr:CpsD/CapB family tyrosine-protein kinase [Herpetosiphon sp.]
MTLDLITVRDPRSPAAEAYRTLRTNLQFSSLDRPLKTLLVTSSMPDEGKSVALANLAVTLAQSERRVVVVDCDLRRPMLHTIFNIKNDVGFTSILLDEVTSVPWQATEVENLRVIPSGPLPARPADVLSSKRIDLVIEKLKGAADIVLFDAPPIISVTDAAVLATKLDGVLLVAHAGKTRRDRVREATQLLEKVKAHVVGVVLTNAQREKGTYANY